VATTTITYAWRGTFENDEVNGLHAEAFETRVFDVDWVAQVEHFSLGWVVARDEVGSLVGFVNVAWDGGVHAFLLDTMVSAAARRQGIGVELVRVATDETRKTECEWLHVDFDDHLSTFYFEACGFSATPAGLIAL
jgi:ribosomal protein S18 acetylase RimI-like enzyme